VVRPTAGVLGGDETAEIVWVAHGRPVLLQIEVWPALSQQVSGLLCVPGEVHGLEPLHCLFEEGPVAAGDAEGADRERLGEGALLQPVRRFCLDALAVAERGKSVQEGGNRLPLPVEVG
jgi:hypothetical protein